jgi:hypothetical protein
VVQVLPPKKQPKKKKKRRVTICPIKEKSTETAEAAKLPNRPITATITFHDVDFVESIIKRVTANVGDLMVSYFMSNKN